MSLVSDHHEPAVQVFLAVYFLSSFSSFRYKYDATQPVSLILSGFSKLLTQYTSLFGAPKWLSSSSAIPNWNPQHWDYWGLCLLSISCPINDFHCQWDAIKLQSFSIRWCKKMNVDFSLTGLNNVGFELICFLYWYCTALTL